jgi:outer membrane protein TolC
VRIAEEAFAAGRIAKYDLLRNQTDLAEAQQQLNNAQRDVETALIDLKNMMGISQSSQLTLAQDLAVQAAPPTLGELQATALKQRPEVQAAQARIRSAQATVGVAKSAYKPQVYATGMADLSVMKGNSMNGSTDTGYLVGVTAALPILDGGLRRSSVNEAQAMVGQMQADERMAVLDVSKSVATAYAQFNAATKNVGLAQAAVTAAEEDYRVIRMRYEAGKATNVEVLDSLASLTRARTNYAEALYSQSTARETLLRATGQR